MLIVINHEPDIDKIYLYAKDPYETKYQLLISKIENTGLEYLNDSKDFVEYSSHMHDVYKYIEEYNPSKKWEILIALDDMLNNPIVTELFFRRRKLNISLVFITQSYFAVSKKLD